MTLLVNPAPRWSCILSELPTSSELILMGGKSTANIYNGITSYGGLLGDTWKWSSGSWTNISPGFSGNSLTNPLPRFDSCASYDGTTVSMVGGTDGISNLTTTWQYSVGGGWTLLTTSDTISYPGVFSVPTQLRGACMAYQSSDGYAILFGGQASYQRHYVLDTWQLSGSNTWTLLSPTTYPNARMYAAMASNATKAMMFGGKNFDGPLSDTWVFNAGNWSQVSRFTPGVNCPSARYGHSIIYDQANSLFVLFGGISTNSYMNDTWTFNITTNTWTNVSPATSPAPRAFFGMAYNSSASNSLLFGGLGYAQSYGDSWVYSASLNTWTQQ